VSCTMDVTRLARLVLASIRAWGKSGARFSKEEPATTISSEWVLPNIWTRMAAASGRPVPIAGSRQFQSNAVLPACTYEVAASLQQSIYPVLG
jgi:hypothetical protein